MPPFQPKGDRSLRVIVTELALKAGENELITFARLAAALALDADSEHDKGKIRQAVVQARPGLLKRHQRALVSVRGEGYRVARPGEFAGMAERYREQGEKRITRALAVIDHAPVGAMTPAELRRHKAIGYVIRSLNDRVNNQAQLIESAQERLADLEAAVFGPPKPVIQGEAEPVTPAADGDGLSRLEAAVFRRG